MKAIKNRIKALREARGWSLEDVAERMSETSQVPTQASTVHKLETGAMKLTTEWMERLGKAFGVHPVDVIYDRPHGGFAEPDLAGYDASDGPSIVQQAARRGRGLYRVISNALDEIGIVKGGVVEVDESLDAVRRLATGDVVTADVEGEDGAPASSVMREYVEPSLLITNSREENALPINMRRQTVRITGVVVAYHMQIGPKK